MYLYPWSEQKRGTSSYLPKKINTGNDTSARKKASVERIIASSHNNYNDDGIGDNMNNGEIMEERVEDTCEDDNSDTHDVRYE